jgi:hypothetical protein
MAAGPAVAAGSVSRASGNAVQLTLTGSTQGTGTFTATNDGHGEHTTGTNQPALALLGGQRLIAAGTLFQDATARVTDHTGTSAGCAGLAGDGATLVAIGESRCIAPGQNLRLDLGNIDLAQLVANVTIVDNDQLDQALSGPQQQLADNLGPVLTQLNAALAQARGQLGDAGLFLDLDAIQGVCHASPGGATGSADLANVALYAQVPGQGKIYLADVPVNPAANTRVPVQLDQLLTAVIDGLETNFAQALQGKLTAIDPALDQVQQQLVDGAVAQIAPQLKPIADNLVNLTLNEQSRPAAGSIAVTALDLNVLPAANQQAGMTVFNLKVGNVTCGPDGVVEAAAPPADHQVRPPKHPKVPRSVPAGEVTAPRSAAASGPTAAGLAALLLASVGAGAAAYVRRVRG